MKLKFSDGDRREYLAMTKKNGLNWVAIFDGNQEFYSAAYWDLFNGFWEKDRPARKTDAAKFMKGIKSALTAGKHIDTAIEYGYLIEEDNPKDARSKLIRLSPQMKKKLDKFFDLAVDNLGHTWRKIHSAETTSK